MNDTTIYTNDRKNNSVYSTTDKLYHAYGIYKDKEYITVGTNDQNSLNNGLHIDKNYWRKWVWLRAPSEENRKNALAILDGIVNGFSASGVNDLVPAFELNLSSVIFGSVVPAATSGGLYQPTKHLHCVISQIT